MNYFSEKYAAERSFYILIVKQLVNFSDGIIFFGRGFARRNSEENFSKRVGKVQINNSGGNSSTNVQREVGRTGKIFDELNGKFYLGGFYLF